VTLGEKQDLLKSALVATQANWLVDRGRTARDLRCVAKIRYNHAPQPARLSVLDEQSFRVDFEQPQTAITPGQAVVLYDGDVLLGGGWIERTA
jgi:tRNA-specific 2-thiouridylase